MELLLVCDHSMVRQALKFYLHELDSSVAVTAAGSLTEALKLSSKTLEFDMIILDSIMGGVNDFAGLESMAAHFPDVPVVILSGAIDRNTALQAIDAGAAGVIPKELSAEVLINALNLILSGEKYLPLKFLRGDENGQHLPIAESRPTDPHGLTARQRQVLDLLTQGLPNKKIAAQLSLQEVTVKLHVSNIFKKLGATNRTEAVRIGMGCRPQDLRQPVNAD